MHALSQQPVAQIRTPKLIRFAVSVHAQGRTYAYQGLYYSSCDAISDAIARFPSDHKVIKARKVKAS